MQVIAPDLYGTYGGKSAAREDERAVDGLFDSLLRREEARHSRESQPQRAPWEAPEAARPAADDHRPHEQRPDEQRPDEQRPDEHRAHEHRADLAEEVPAERDSSLDTAHDDPVTRPEAAPEKTRAAEARPESVGQVGSEAASATSQAAAQPAQATPAASSNEPAAAPVQTASAVPTQAVAKPANSNTAAAGIGASASGLPAAATGGESGAAPAATAQPASGAAAAQRPADKAPPVAAAKEPSQPAATHGQAPAAARGEPTGRPGARNGQPGTTTQSATFDSRPAAAMGGGAATAAMAQAEGGAKTAGTEGTPAAPEDAPGFPAAKGAASTGQATKSGDVLANAAKAAEGRLAASERPADVAPTGSGPALPATAAAPAGVGGTSPVHNGSFAETLAQARHGVPADPAQQIALQVQRAQVAGQDQISIKLHPAELGRIEVKLESNSDGTLRAVISAERSETLDLLQRDSRTLERALQDAGVKTDSGSLSFNLRGQGQQQDQRQTADGNASRPGDGPSQGSDQALSAPAPAYRSSHNGALDIRV